MKPNGSFYRLVIVAIAGGLIGYLIAREQARVAVLSGPYSDNYEPALLAIGEAKAKLQAGDTNVFKNLNEAEIQIMQAQRWTRRFLGQPDSATNRSQPIRSDTNATPSAAAGSHR